MPFVVISALGIFMDYMNMIFHPFLDQFVVIFINDILIYSKTLEEHEEHKEHLQIVLQILKEKKLYAKFSKCEFWLEEVKFFGNVISNKGVLMDPTKVEAVLQWEPQKIVNEIHNFFGLAGYYRRFINRFSKIAIISFEMVEKPRRGVELAS